MRSRPAPGFVLRNAALADLPSARQIGSRWLADQHEVEGLLARVGLVVAFDEDGRGYYHCRACGRVRLLPGGAIACDPGLHERYYDEIEVR